MNRKKAAPIAAGRPEEVSCQDKLSCERIIPHRAGIYKEETVSVFEKIEAQQKGKENTVPWMVGEQLKDICRREPLATELVEKDLDVKEMSLVECEKKIKAYADSHKKGSCAVVPPNVAEKIIRKFYGIPEAGKDSSTPLRSAQNDTNGVINFADFL